jgi:hypothetical protein
MLSCLDNFMDKEIKFSIASKQIVHGQQDYEGNGTVI